MAIKKFSAYINEGTGISAASNFVAPKDSDEEVTKYKPRSKGEEDFANAHTVTKHDYPVDVEAQFSGGNTQKPRQPNNGEKNVKQGSTDVNQPKGGGDSKRTADKKQGDMKPVNPVKEEVELDEGIQDKKAVAAIKAMLDGMSKKDAITKFGVSPKKLDQVRKDLFKEEVELDENKSLIKDYQDMKSQGKKDSDIIDVLMSMPKYKRMDKDQMRKIIGDARRKGIFKEEAELFEGKVLDALQDIVKTKSAKKVKFANGKSTRIDMTTANAMVNLHKKLNPQNKKKMEDAIEKSPEMLMRLMDVAFKG